MREIVLETLIYVIDHPVLTIVFVFFGGFLANRIVLAERRLGVIGFTFLGLLGFLIGHFMIMYSGWNERLDDLRDLRVVVEFLAACVGSFVVAGIVHFIKPS